MGNDPLDSKPSTLFPDGVFALQEAVRELLSSSWDEIQQRRAQEVTHALLQSAKQEHRWESENLLRALESLLALSLATQPAQRAAAGIRVAELVSLLKRAPESRSA